MVFYYYWTSRIDSPFISSLNISMHLFFSFCFIFLSSFFLFEFLIHLARKLIHHYDICLHNNIMVVYTLPLFLFTYYQDVYLHNTIVGVYTLPWCLFTQYYNSLFAQYGNCFLHIIVVIVYKKLELLLIYIVTFYTIL